MPERIERRGAHAQRTFATMRSVCDAERAFAVLERALELAQLHAVPEESEPFARFVHGPLAEAARATLDEDAARAITGALIPRGAEDARPAPQPARMVIVACAEPARANAVRAALPKSSFEVRVARDLPTLVQEVEGHLDRRLSIVLDGSVPGVSGPLLSTLARLMPQGASLLFRGDPPSGLYAVGLAWTTLPEDASVEAVVQHLVGDPPPQQKTRSTVLVLVEPDPPTRASLGARFEAAGYVVVRCEHALAALEASIDHEPDLLVAARAMPRLDGLALARLVRARMGDSAPTVLLRGAGQLDRDDAKLARMVGEDELLDEVRELAPTGR